MPFEAKTTSREYHRKFNYDKREPIYPERKVRVFFIVFQSKYR